MRHPVLLIIVFFTVIRAQQQLLDANLVDATGADQLLSTVLRVKDVIESPNCLPATQFSALADQVLAQTNCRDGVELLVALSRVQLNVEDCPYPYLLRGAAAALYRVAASGGSERRMKVTAALQPFLFQYTAFRRGYLRICGTVNAAPYVGTTLHERGATVSVEDGAGWAPFFAASPVWQRNGPNEFTYTGPDTLNAGRRMVETFQRMWADAYAWDPIAASGEWDTATQARAERALVTGIREARLCASVDRTGGSFNARALLLVIAVPLGFAAAALALYIYLQTRLHGAYTPFDSGSGSNGRDVLQVPARGDMFNSVEDTSALSEYANTIDDENNDDDDDDDGGADDDDDDDGGGIWKD